LIEKGGDESPSAAGHLGGGEPVVKPTFFERSVLVFDSRLIMNESIELIEFIKYRVPELIKAGLRRRQP